MDSHLCYVSKATGVTSVDSPLCEELKVAGVASMLPLRHFYHQRVG